MTIRTPFSTNFHLSALTLKSEIQATFYLFYIWWHLVPSDEFESRGLKYPACRQSPHGICHVLQSVAADSFLPLCAGCVHHFTLTLLIAWKVCCGKRPACKSCILDETHSRWGRALQSGPALIKYQLALLPHLISCHIHTLSGLVEEKLKWKWWPCGFIQFAALLQSSVVILWILTWFLWDCTRKKLNLQLDL